LAAPIERSLEEVIAARWRELGFTRVLVTEPVPVPAEPTRWDVPEQLPGTGMLSGYEELDGPLTLIRLFKSQRWLWDPLRRAAAALEPEGGDHRIKGCWELVHIAWVDSGKPDVQPFYRKLGAEFWQECLFERIPSYKTVQRRLVELEEIDWAFAEALHRLVQHARKRDPRIGTAVAIDSTMVETNARPHILENGGKLPKKLTDLPALGSQRLPTVTADNLRRATVAEAPEAGAIQIGEYIDRTVEVTTTLAADGRYKIATTHSGKHYISRDPDAGFRVYQRGGRAIVWWFGYFVNQPIDDLTGLPLEAIGFSANEYEAYHYQEAVEKAEATTGACPFWVSTDKAYALWDCYAYSARRGITQVTPYRPPSRAASKRAEATDLHDEHGVPFCRNPQCRGGTDQIGFVIKPPKGPGGQPRPVLRVKCSAPVGPECEGVQEVSCMRDPTRLLPVFRTHPGYTEVRSMHSSYERSHNEARSRATAKPRYFETRSKRVSLSLAVMRANTGALIAWLRASVINGWLGNQPFNPSLQAANQKLHQQRRTNHQEWVLERMYARRRRLGRLGGGRHPPRKRGSPTRGEQTPT
jgi:hypothetical protein